METAKVHCPACGRRLFDVDKSRPISGKVQVKCPRCKKIVVLDLAAETNAPKA